MDLAGGASDGPRLAGAALPGRGGFRGFWRGSSTAGGATFGVAGVGGRPTPGVAGVAWIGSSTSRVRRGLGALSPVSAEGHFFDWDYGQATYRAAKAFRAAGFEWRGFHAARKHSGTRLYQATKDFTRVGLFLGHASVDTTRRYVAVLDNDVAPEVEDW